MEPVTTGTGGMALEGEMLASGLDRLEALLKARAERERALERELEDIRAGYHAQAHEIARLNARLHALLSQHSAVAEGLDGAIARIERLAQGAA